MNDLSQPNQGAASSRLECVVMKFGGTSLEDAAAIRRACRLVTRRAPLRPTVVVSALAGVTDQLMHMGWAAAEGRPGFARESLQQLRQRHQAVAGGLIAGEPCNRLGREFEAQCMEIEKAVSSIAAEKAFTPQSQDRLLGVGESLSSKLVHAALRSAGVDAAWVDARECIITDAAHTRATPLWLETEQRLDAVVRPLLESGRIPVMGGFVGATRDGIATTLGRGGSDFSAALVGAGLHARRIEIWTDVDGIMTTDPNLCSEARRVARMSFEEAAELAFFGAKVLHPATLAPAMGRNVPVWVLNARNPECPGTEIVTRSAGVHDADASQVKAITSRRGLAIVDVEAVRWFAPELLREVFEVFERHQHSLDLLSASRGSLALVVSSVTALPAIAEELKGLARVRWENHKALVCLVGDQIRRRPEIASRAFRAIADINVRMICQGASERNIGFLVEQSRAVECVQRLHGVFFPAAESVVKHGTSRVMCQAEGAWQ